MKLRTEAGIFGYVAFITWIGAIIVIFRRQAKAIVGAETWPCGYHSPWTRF